MRKMLVLAVASALVLSFGCHEKTPEERGKEALKTAAAKVPTSADKVVLEAVRATKEGDYVAVYAMLPASYQADLQAMYKKVADKVDPAMYARAWGILEKAFAAAKKHQDKILEATKMPKETLEQGIAAAESVLAMAKEIKLNDAAAMKGLDLAAFLAENGKKLHELGWKTAETFQKDEAGEAKKMLEGIKAELKDAKDAEATVVLSMGEDKTEVVFVKVEERWIPKDMADGWAAMKEEANKNIDEMLAGLEKNKEQITKGMDEAEKAITEFEKDGDMNKLGGLMSSLPL